jgi:hypothetical protein
VTVTVTAGAAASREAPAATSGRPRRKSGVQEKEVRIGRCSSRRKLSISRVGMTGSWRPRKENSETWSERPGQVCGSRGGGQDAARTPSAGGHSRSPECSDPKRGILRTCTTSDRDSLRLKSTCARTFKARPDPNANVNCKSLTESYDKERTCSDNPSAPGTIMYRAKQSGKPKA